MKILLTMANSKIHIHTPFTPVFTIIGSNEAKNAMQFMLNNKI